MVCKSLVQVPYEWILYCIVCTCISVCNNSGIKSIHFTVLQKMLLILSARVCVCDLCVITHIYSKVVWFYEVAVCPVCFRGAVLVSGPCQSLSWPTTEYHRHSGCVLSYRYSLHTLQLSWKHLHHQGTTITIARVYSCCHLLSTATMCHCITLCLLSV